MKKFLLTTALLSITTFGSVSAQEVTVSGTGLDRDSAVRNAAQNAVEQVVGVYINSNTLVKDLRLELDEVYRKSQGYVKNIQILEEGKTDYDMYRVRARIDVDTNPDGKLIDKLTMILQLNDPRIAVIVINNNTNNQSERDIFAEGYLAEKLLSLGFNHVIDTDRVIKNDNAIDNILHGNSDNAVDYVVIGRYITNNNAVKIPDFSNSNNQDYNPEPIDGQFPVQQKSSSIGMKNTGLQNIKLMMKVNVIKYDTGELVGTFAVAGNDIHINEKIGTQNALAQASNQAAEKLSDTFKKFSAQPVRGLTFTITANSEQQLQQIINEFRSLGMINNFYIREIKLNRAVLSVDSVQNPHAIVDALKNRTNFNVSIENMTNSNCELRIS